MFAPSLDTFSGDSDTAYREAQKLYRFACVLTANEKLANPLFRESGISSSRPVAASVEAYARFYGQWNSKLVAHPTLQQTFPPDPRLFTTEPKWGTHGANAHLSKFFAHMPWQQRSALFLVYGERFSYDVAAEIANLSLQALMKRLAKGHAALASWQEHQGLRADSDAHREMGRAA